MTAPNSAPESTTLGTFTFMLHSHIPYVLSHGISPHGTDWLAEAACETYLPLLNVCNRLVSEGISPRITLGLTPVLVEQLCDPDFNDELLDYFNGKIAQAKADQLQFASEGQYHMAYVARWWEDWYTSCLLYTSTPAQPGTWNAIPKMCIRDRN